MQFGRTSLTLVAPFVVFYLVILLALRYEAVGVLLALVGAAVTVGGLWYLVLALSPDNRAGNQLYELAVASGAAATLAGGLLIARGVWTGTIAAKRKRTGTSPDQRP